MLILPLLFSNIMLLLIVLMPLLGYISGSFFSRHLGHGVCYITLISILISFFLSTFLFLDILCTECPYSVNLIVWRELETSFVVWGFYFDSLTSIMLLVVTFFSTVVHSYSIKHMRRDSHLGRFLSYLSLLTFFTLALVTSSNFLQLFVGLEGVGLSSCLICDFWLIRILVNKPAIKALLANRVGDFFLLISLFICYSVFNTSDYKLLCSPEHLPLIAMLLLYLIVLYFF